MSSKPVAVDARGVSKNYRIAHEERATTLGESIVRKIKNPLGRSTRETFWALKDVSFEINEGDVVGIIGRNGAGKSTLLKILSRITAPSDGLITIRGRVGSLLEVGTGFHPELTGRENIYLNGAILGMSRREIEKRFDEIVEFSGVEQFLDTPVKRFSSGMYVRLAFSVAAHLEPEVMIVDEVQGVGEADLRKKCLGKMQDVASSGRTILFVSHNMQTVTQLCTTAMVLQSGQLIFMGDTDSAIARYVSVLDDAETESVPENRPGTGEYRITSVTVDRPTIQSGEPIDVRFVVEHKHSHSPVINTAFHLRDEAGTVVLHGDSRLVQFTLGHAERQVVDLKIAGVNLKPGRYRIDLALHMHGVIDTFEGATKVDVSQILPARLATSDFGYQGGQVIAEMAWSSSEKP